MDTISFEPFEEDDAVAHFGSFMMSAIRTTAKIISEKTGLDIGYVQMSEGRGFDLGPMENQSVTVSFGGITKVCEFDDEWETAYQSQMSLAAWRMFHMILDELGLLKPKDDEENQVSDAA